MSPYDIIGTKNNKNYYVHLLLTYIIEKQTILLHDK